jgi:hypothetical protein
MPGSALRRHYAPWFKRIVNAQYASMPIQINRVNRVTHTDSVNRAAWRKQQPAALL